MQTPMAPAAPQPDCSHAAERNKQPILDVLRTLLPQEGAALEIASGTGQHVAWFAKALPLWTWQPTENHPGALYNIAYRLAQDDLPNVLAPQALDVSQLPWRGLGDQPAAPTPATGNSAPAFDLIFCANMLHIAPWEACVGLMQGSAHCLAPGGSLVTYGPYFEADHPTAPSNQAFDQSLREYDPRWGIRTLTDVAQQAQAAGLRLNARHAMPHNNLLLVWARA